jgi:hypothetical protein
VKGELGLTPLRINESASFKSKCDFNCARLYKFADVTGAGIRYLSEGLRRKGEVSVEVLQARGRIAREVRSGLPWVFTPALLMFYGALILVLPRGRRGTKLAT